MKGFLEEVASDLHSRYGERLSEFSVLFPSRRARLFFTEALQREIGRPMWQPHWVSIDDLMSEISGLRTTERVRLITELYKIYSRYHEEPFDKFYFWGDMLLTDFDTIDKYMIDAGQLFRNITDLKELEADISYLTPRQIEIIRHFWSTLGEEADLSVEKERFLKIWRSLGTIYAEFRNHLSALGIAYNGMVHRAAAERLEAGDFSFDAPRHFVVAGFNALSECERRLFKFLSTAAETDFYWDWDSYYVDNAEQEAGMFVRRNIADFPPQPAISHDNISAVPKQMTTVAAVSNAVQCKYVATILAQLQAQLRERSGDPEAVLGKETAIVLTDENLLLPLLYALPRDLGHVNVTMGFPLKSTLAYTFVERLVELQNHSRRRGEEEIFYHADVEGLLAHPYIADDNPSVARHLRDDILRERRIMVAGNMLAETPLLAALFRRAEGWREMSAYIADVVAVVARVDYSGDDARQRIEFLAVIAEEIARLENSLEGCDIELTQEVYASLLRRHLQTLRIPFEGEPLEGVQIMGILETRNLDFENVIILSMTDDNFPGNLVGASSFVPYNLRAAFELPTPEHHEGVYAYYFYRLIQRASSVHMLYCSHADDKSTGEPSRYIYQLDYESDFRLHKVEVGVDVNLADTAPVEVPKSDRIMARLAEFTDPGSQKRLSPSSFFPYVACPLRFYFATVAALGSDEEVTDEVDAPMFGTILHDAIYELYKPLIGMADPSSEIARLLEGDAVERAVEWSVNKNFLCNRDASVEDYSGNLLLVKDIVTRYLRSGVIPFDCNNGGFMIDDLECDVFYDFPFRAGNRDLKLKFKGRADRIDRLADGALRVVDYKTGGVMLDFAGLNSLFHGEAKERLSNILQTLLYSMMLYRSRGEDVEPALYYVRKINQPDYSPQLNDVETGERGVRYSRYAADFESLMRETLAEIYDPDISFRQCEDPVTCQFCDFNSICRR